MPNRAARRRAMREQTGKHRQLLEEYTHQQRIEGLIRNGITPQDVEQEYHTGYDDGYKFAASQIIKCCYAAVILALTDEFGFTPDQCEKALNCVDKRTAWAIDHFELADEVMRKTGLKMEFDEEFDRITRV